jgi:hypothetical protein
MNETIINELKKLAGKEAWCDCEDFIPYDYAGGNFDDAYYGGTSDGGILLARSILQKMGIAW